jgi:hypothetical protein
MRFTPECKYQNNAGLGEARELLEEIQQKHPGNAYQQCVCEQAGVFVDLRAFICDGSFSSYCFQSFAGHFIT